MAGGVLSTVDEATSLKAVRKLGLRQFTPRSKLLERQLPRQGRVRIAREYGNRAIAGVEDAAARQLKEIESLGQRLQDRDRAGQAASAAVVAAAASRDRLGAPYDRNAKR